MLTKIFAQPTMQNINGARQLVRTQMQKAIWNTEYIRPRAFERSEFLVVRTCSKRNAYTHMNASLQSAVRHLRPQFFAAPPRNARHRGYYADSHRNRRPNALIRSGLIVTDWPRAALFPHPRQPERTPAAF